MYLHSVSDEHYVVGYDDHMNASFDRQYYLNIILFVKLGKSYALVVTFANFAFGFGQALDVDLDRYISLMIILRNKC